MTKNRAPDPRSAEEEPGNIQIRSPYPRKHLRRIKTRERIRCMLARTSTGTHHLRPGTHVLLRHLADGVQPETPDPMGLVELTSATTWPLRGIGIRSARRNEEREPEPRRSRNEGGIRHHSEGSHCSWSQHHEGRRETLMVEAKNLIGPSQITIPTTKWRRWRRRRRPEISLPLKIPRPQGFT
jgi:hypothetical protein